MKVKVNDFTFYVQWRHYNNVGQTVNKMDNHIYSSKSTISWTECIIKNAETGEIERQGRAFLGKKEKNYNKDTGRRVALAEGLTVFPKEIRKLFWEAYFEYTNQKYRK
jgi:hypothetical protein